MYCDDFKRKKLFELKSTKNTHVFRIFLPMPKIQGRQKIIWIKIHQKYTCVQNFSSNAENSGAAPTGSLCTFKANWSCIGVHAA